MIGRPRPYRTYLAVDERTGAIVRIKTRDERPIWSLLKEYINAFEVGQTFTRVQMLDHIYDVDHYAIKMNINMYENQADKYRSHLSKAGVLKVIDRGVYEKVRDVPMNLTTTLLKEIATKNTWRGWFIQLDHLP